MVKDFGQEIFNPGYQVLKENDQMIYNDEDETQIMKLLNHLKFADEDSLKSFIQLTSSYIMCKNMKL